MLFWILVGLAVYVVNVFLPATLYLPREGLIAHLGSRDNLPDADALTGRARRSLANMQESLPIFLALALLAMIVPDADMAQALLGAQIWVIARVVYMVMYLISITGLRSAVWTVGVIGNIIQVMALI